MKLNQLAELIGISEKDGVFRSEFKGYPMQLVIGRYSFQKLNYIVFLFNDKVSDEAYKAIRSKNSAFRKPLMLSVMKENNGLAYLVNLKKADDIRDFILKQTEIFVDLGLKGLKDSIFNDGEADAFKLISVQPKYYQYELQDIMIPINKENFDKIYQEQVNAVIIEDTDSSGLFKSLMLALLGAFIGAIPASIVYALGYFSGWAFAIIPFASFYMYKLGKGPKAGYILGFIGLFSFIASVVAIFINWQLLAMQYELSLLDLFLVEEVVNAMLQELLMTIVFFVLGMVISWQYLYKDTTTKRLKDLSKIK